MPPGAQAHQLDSSRSNDPDMKPPPAVAACPGLAAAGKPLCRRIIALMVTLALLCTVGCQLLGQADPSLTADGLQAPQSRELFRQIRQAEANQAVILEVVGDSPPFRVLPLPPEDQSVFVSELLAQTGVQEKLGRIKAVVYRATPEIPAGLPMEVRFYPRGGEIRAECDYALRPGDRLRVAKDDSLASGLFDWILP